ncbi:hypothetical protein SLT36_05095 [Aminobacter sp. BA135]|uniref:hypothetical protein n=1 Tax=Aminobacter sp. BA135 TaxID=537596 RepID=UPI003D7902DB
MPLQQLWRAPRLLQQVVPASSLETKLFPEAGDLARHLLSLDRLGSEEAMSNSRGRDVLLKAAERPVTIIRPVGRTARDRARRRVLAN